MARQKPPPAAALSALLAVIAVFAVYRKAAEPAALPGGREKAPPPGGAVANPPSAPAPLETYSPQWKRITESPGAFPRSAVRLAAFPDLAALSAGESVTLPLENGETVEGRVVLVTDVDGDDGVRRVGGELAGGKGGFSFGFGRGRAEGAVIFKNGDRAALYAGNADQMEVLGARASELMCRGLPAAPPRGAAAPPGAFRDVSRRAASSEQPSLRLSCALSGLRRRQGHRSQVG